MNQVTISSPGALIQSDSAGSTGQPNDYFQNWEIASNGLVSFAINYEEFYWQLGRPPYATCYITGYKAPRAMMVQVDGKWYLPEFVPVSRFQF